MIYTPRGWSIIVDNQGDLTEFRRVNNADGGGSRIDEKALADPTAGAHNDYLFGGAGNDMILGQVGNDILGGGEGDDILFGDEDHITEKPTYADGTSAEGDDELYGGAGSDHLYGGGGDDILYADASYNDAKPHSASDNETDYLYGGEGDDTLYAGSGNDELYGGEGDDRLYGGTDHTIVSGEAGNDYLEAGVVESGPGNFLHGGEGDDVLVSNLGQHQLQGGTGHDIYEYSSDLLRQDRGGINDLILDEDGDWSLILDGRTISSAELMKMSGTPYWVARDGSFFFEADGNDLWFSLCDAEGQAVGKPVLIKNGISQAEFIQGEIVEANEEGIWGTAGDDIISAPSEGGIVFGQAGNDSLVGSEGPDTLRGGEGDDAIYGGGGNDALYGDDGDDIIYGGAGDDYIVAGGGNDRIYGGAGNDIINGGSGNNIIYGGDGDDQIQGGTGSNRTYGGEGDDVIYVSRIAEPDGGTISNIIDGGGGNDVYVSYSAFQTDGSGNQPPHDTVFLFGRGGGHDQLIINRNTRDSGASLESNHNIVRLQGLNREDVDIFLDVSRTYTYAECVTFNPGRIFVYNLVIRIKETGETFTVKEPYATNSSDSSLHPKDTYGNSLTEIEFANGENLDWSTLGFKYDSGDGNVFLMQRVYGQPFSFLYLPDLGRDDVIFNEVGQYLLMTVKATGDVLRIGTSPGSGISHGVENIVFGGGQGAAGAFSLMSALPAPTPGLLVPLQQLLEEARGDFGTAGDDLIQGNPQGGYIFGAEGRDVLIGSKKDDLINGGSGANTIYGGEGNDVLTSDSLTFYGQYDTSSLLFGGAGDDVLRGGVVHGGAGNDTFIINNNYSYVMMDGDSGPESTEVDVLWFAGANFEDGVKIRLSQVPIRWTQPSETLEYPGDSYEISVGSSGSANVYFGHRDWSSLRVRFADGSEMTWLEVVQRAGITIDYPNTAHYQGGYDKAYPGTEFNDIIESIASDAQLYGPGEYINGKGGDDLLKGSGGDDLIEGGSGHDVLIGNYGNDILDGGSGNDVYVFNRGDGRDVINNFDSDSGRRDIIRFGQDVLPDHLILSRQVANDDDGHDDLVINFYNNPVDRITVKNFFAPDGSWAINGFEFADGSAWTYEAIISNLNGKNTTAGSSEIDGGDHREVISGGEGNDRLRITGQGSQVVVFGRGSGHDTLENVHNYYEVPVAIRLTGLTMADVEFYTSAVTAIAAGVSTEYPDQHNLVIRIKDTGETLTIINAIEDGHNYGYKYRRDATEHSLVEFADGTKLTWPDIYALPEFYTGESTATPGSYWTTAYGGTVHGDARGNYIYGSTGADTLYGGDGDDYLVGCLAGEKSFQCQDDDYLHGGAGNDTFLVAVGHDVINAYDTNPAKHDVIRLSLWDAYTEEDIRHTAVYNESTGKYDWIIINRNTGETTRVLSAISAPGDSDFNPYSIQALDRLYEVISWDQLYDPSWINGLTGGGKVLFAGAESCRLVGTVAADEIYGGRGDNDIQGGGGNDFILTGQGRNRVDGGAGNDTISVGYGSNTIVFGRGSGHDRVIKGINNTNDTLTIDLSTLRRDEVTFAMGMTGQNAWASGTGSLDRSRSLVITIISTGETLTLLPLTLGYFSFQEWQDHGYMDGGLYLAGVKFADGDMDWLDICRANNWMGRVEGSNDGELIQRDSLGEAPGPSMDEAGMTLLSVEVMMI